MKVLFFHSLAASVCFSSSQEATCEECTTIVGNLVARLTSDESIQEQIAILVGTLCPADPVPEDCEAGIPRAWPEIAAAMYPVFLSADELCGPECGTVTCETCTDGLAQLQEYLAGRVNEIVHFLQNEGFCDNHPDVQHCPADMERLIRAAVPVL